MLITSTVPSNWKDLEKLVKIIFIECGYIAHQNNVEKGIRTSHNIDVSARSYHRGLASTILCECKNLNRPVQKLHVFALRCITQDTGANHGYMISTSGYSKGAREAAIKSQVTLFTWEEFQQHMLKDWIVNNTTELYHIHHDKIMKIARNIQPSAEATTHQDALLNLCDAIYNLYDIDHTQETIETLEAKMKSVADSVLRISQKSTAERPTSCHDILKMLNELIDDNNYYLQILTHEAQANNKGNHDCN